MPPRQPIDPPPGRVRLVDVDLAEPVEDLDGLEGHSAALGLVRLEGRPVGWVTLPVLGDECPAEVARARIEARLEDELREARIERSLSRDSPAPLPSITVAVCTRDRTDLLADCLPSLRDLDYPDLDVLVVDNAPSDDATRRLVEEGYPAFRYVREPRPGLDNARNRAVLEAGGEIVAFTDDDCVVDRRWARALGRLFVASPDVDAVTGLVVPLELETEAQRLFELYGGFGRGFRRRWFRAGAGHRGPVALPYVGSGEFGTGANMAFRRKVFRTIGGFDPALDVGTVTNGGGDLDIFFRVIKEGGCLVYEPRAVVRHRHRRDYEAFRTQIANNGVGFYSHLVRNFRAYPDERWGLFLFGVWWLFRWTVRRLVVSLIRPPRLPRDLIFAEMRGSLRGLRAYGRARRAAEEEVHGSPEPDIAEREGSLGPPDPEATAGTAVRLVDVERPLEPLEGLGGASTVTVFVTAGERLLGEVEIADPGRSVYPPRLRDAVVRHLAEEFRIDHRGEEVLSGPGRLVDRLVPLARDRDPPRPGKEPPPSHLPSLRLPREVDVSVVIATLDRPDDLRRCLSGLDAQRTDRSVEIVVVDNNPGSGLTLPVVREFPAVRLVEEERRGVSYARNAGFAAARGKILVITDDDVIVPSHWLERLVAPFARNDVMVVTGNVLPFELETESQRLFERYGGLSRGFTPREADRRWFDSFRGRPVATWLLGGTANAAVRAAVLAEPTIGFLAEELGPGTPAGVGEDTYLFYRVLSRGHTIVYEPSAFLWHRHRPRMRSLLRQIYAYSKGHVAYHLQTVSREGDLRGLTRIALELPLTHLRAALNRLLGRSRYPLTLTAIEVVGNLMGPPALLRSRLRVSRLGRVRDQEDDADRPGETVSEGSALTAD